MMGLATSVVVTRDADAADAGSSTVDSGADAADAGAPGSTSAGDEYLRSMARRLLDNSDIVKAGRDLLDRPGRAPAGPAPGATGATGAKGGPAGSSGATGTGSTGAAAGTTGAVGTSGNRGPAGTTGAVGPGGKGGPAGTTGAVGPGGKGSPIGTTGAAGSGTNGSPAGTAGGNAAGGVAGANGGSAAGGVAGANGGNAAGGAAPGLLPDGAVVDGFLPSDDATAAAVANAADEGDSASSEDAGDEASTDAGTTQDAASALAGEDAAGATPEGGESGGLFGGGSGGRKGAPKSGDPMEMKGAQDSPLAKLGIPAKAVPAAATAAAAGAMAIWPAIAKTVTGLFKKLLAAKLKDRAKKSEKVDAAATTYLVLGMPVRPAEIASIAVAALVYGLAISYTFQGFKMQRTFVLSQETLVFLLFYFRSFIRFAYERAFKLTTQYRFWIMGGILCLGTAYLGNPLGTVGFELEAAKTPEETRRALRLKAVLVAVGFAMAIGFYAWNRVSPGKLLQSGRVMMSGAALAEILPIAPMPGRKILTFSKPLWLLMFAVIVPGFFVLNFVK
jgi:hypothetical protein